MQALHGGAIAQARHLLAELRHVQPDNPNVPLIAGILAYREGNLAEASTQLNTLVGRCPSAPGAHFWLGNALYQAAMFSEARLAYDAAVLLGSADAVHNLESAFREETRAKIGAHLIRSHRVTPRNTALLQRAVEVAGELARAGIHAPSSCAVLRPPRMPAISVITCSITPRKLERLTHSLRAALAGCEWELIAITDARSLCEGYTRGLARAQGELVVFCHDDIEVLCDRFAERLLNACDGADMVGVVGTTLLNGPALSWGGTPHLHGAVTHPGSGDGFCPSLCSSAGPAIDGAQALDGLFIAAWRDVARAIGFDAHTFDAFDFYDIDFSYRAHKAGMRLRIQADLALWHESRGKFAQQYLHYSDRFRRKHREFATCPPFSQPFVFETCVTTRAQARIAHEWLWHWQRLCADG